LSIIEGPNKWKVRPVAEFYFDNVFNEVQTYSARDQRFVLIVAKGLVLKADVCCVEPRCLADRPVLVDPAAVD
jgi:hypothetical protein